jgi:Lon protease-like protein
MERACPPRPEGKPSFWWRCDREPWRRVSAELIADEKQKQADQRAAAVVLSLLRTVEAPPVMDWE